MKDIEVFKKFMEWMQMEAYGEKVLDNGDTVLQFYDTGKDSEVFTKVGYDEFSAGIIFDKDGNMVKGYIDSHVTSTSSNFEFMVSL